MRQPDQIRLQILRTAIALLFACIPASMIAAESSDEANRVVYSVKGAFEDIRADVSDAILEQGLVISSVSNVGEMLERTGKDLGIDESIFHKAEVLEFCSAIISRQALAADPHGVIYCPYRIAIYALSGSPDQVYLAFPKLRPISDPQSTEALGAVERLLRDIIEAAIE